MKTLKDVLQDYIAHNDFIEDGLYHDYINLSSFALFLKPNIEKQLQKTISLASIKMALSRISEEIQTQKEPRVIKQKNFFIKKHLHIFTIPRSRETTLQIEKIFESEIDVSKHYLSVVTGNSEINLYCSELIVEQVQSFLPQDITISIGNIAAIGISLDEQMLDTPGMFYTLCKRLTFFGVNILDITSTYREIVFFVREEDLKKAIQVLVD